MKVLKPPLTPSPSSPSSTSAPEEATDPGCRALCHHACAYAASSGLSLLFSVSLRGSLIPWGKGDQRQFPECGLEFFIAVSSQFRSEGNQRPMQQVIE